MGRVRVGFAVPDPVIGSTRTRLIMYPSTRKLPVFDPANNENLIILIM